MALQTQQIADPALIEKLNQRLEEFRKLRVGYIDPTNASSNQKAVENKKVVKEVKKRSLIERFFFSEYH